MLAKSPVLSRYHGRMGIGPVLDCSKELNKNLSSLMALEHIKTERLPVVSPAITAMCIFRRGIARIVGRLRDRDGRTLVWLTTPGTHAFNPLFWYFDHRLLQQVEAVLVRNGAQRADFGEFAETPNQT